MTITAFKNERMIISHNALLHALNDYSAFGVVLVLFFSAGQLSINYSFAVGMSVIDGGGGLSALRMIDITVKRRYVSNDPWSALQV